MRLFRAVWRGDELLLVHCVRVRADVGVDHAPSGSATLFRASVGRRGATAPVQFLSVRAWFPATIL